MAERAQLHALNAACVEYELTFGQLPGYFADEALPEMGLSSTENLALSLLGGVTTGADGEPVVDVNLMGGGPVHHVGLKDEKKYGAFVAVRANEFGAAPGDLNGGNAPEFLGAVTGLPILYLRDRGGEGPPAAETKGGRVLRSGVSPYTDANALANRDGEKYNQAKRSLLALGGEGNLGWIVSAQRAQTPGAGSGSGTLLISPGPDMVYFDRAQIDTHAIPDADTAVNAFDDVVLSGF